MQEAFCELRQYGVLGSLEANLEQRDGTLPASVRLSDDTPTKVECQVRVDNLRSLASGRH
jgi:hypothetical protein